MRKTDSHHYSKVFYRPIEAAIRWSGLTRSESRILDALGDKGVPDSDDFPKWPILRLNTERIFDAVRNGDLPYGRGGITRDDPSLFDDPGLTVRHVDLKAWMSRFYPEQKPLFLFSAIEQQLISAISIKSLQALLAERTALCVQLTEHERSLDVLQTQYDLLRKEAEGRHAAGREPGPRSEATYLNIVGALLTLLLGTSPGGKPYSSFGTMESIISAVLAHHQGLPGISERTLWAKLSAAKRQVNAAPG